VSAATPSLARTLLSILVSISVGDHKTSMKSADSQQGVASLPTADGALRGEETYNALRQEILSCSSPPGSTLTEAWVMRRFGVSKSTCRLALIRLIQQGLVRSVPRQGYIVTPVTMKDVEELFALRLLLEPAAARFAAGHADVRLLKQIEQSARRNPASRNQGNRIGFFLDANREFHVAIAKASGNSRLAQNIAGLLDEMKRLVALGFLERGGSPEIANDHAELIDAIACGDGEAAAQIAHRHVATFRDMALDKVMQSLRANHLLQPLSRLQAQGDT
jgi:DNA-binding GntR family transcriptional regulator